MFFKSLLLSILIHLLLLSWAGASLPFLTLRIKTGAFPDRPVEYRTITLVEIPSPSVVLGVESSAPSRVKATASSPAASPKQSAALPAGGASLASPAQGPAAPPPLHAGSDPESGEAPAVPVQPVAPAGPGFSPSCQDRPTDLPLPTEAVEEEEPGAEREADPAEKLSAKGIPVPANDAITTGEGVPLSGVGNDPHPEFMLPSVAGSDGNLSRGEKTDHPAGFETSSDPKLVKVFHTDPVYPRVARRRGWEGTVYLALRLAPDGKVNAVEITSSSGYDLLDRAAQEAAGQWCYAWPDGEQPPEGEVVITVKIHFQLEK